MDTSFEITQTFISINTPVSAKYRGAFCEAKVTHVELHFDCKVQLDNGRVVHADEKQVRFLSPNDRRVGGQVEFTGSSSICHEVIGKSPPPVSNTTATSSIAPYTIAKIIDLKDKCLYHVEFDDGDTRTLRRSKLVLKGARHFKKEESLDQLPLYNPEQFKNPVRRSINDSSDLLDRRKQQTEDSDTSSTLTRSSSTRRTKVSDNSPSPSKASPTKKGRKSAASGGGGGGVVGGGGATTVGTHLTNRKGNKSLGGHHLTRRNSTKSNENVSSGGGRSSGGAAAMAQCDKDIADSLVGKVVKIMLDDEQLNSLALVVNHTADVSMNVDWPRQVLLKSFKDGRFHVMDSTVAQSNIVNRTDLVRHLHRKQLPVHGPQLEKVMFWLDCEVLPSRWDAEALLSTMEDNTDDRKTTETTSSDIESEPEEQHSDLESVDLEAKDHLYAELISFMEARNTPINTSPTIANKDLDLVQLHNLVMKHGGYKAVTSSLHWPLIYSKMDIPFTSGGPTRLEQAYKKFLLPFEETRRQLGQAATMTLGRRRQSTTTAARAHTINTHGSAATPRGGGGGGSHNTAPAITTPHNNLGIPTPGGGGGDSPILQPSSAAPLPPAAASSNSSTNETRSVRTPAISHKSTHSDRSPTQSRSKSSQVSRKMSSSDTLSPSSSHSKKHNTDSLHRGVMPVDNTSSTIPTTPTITTTSMVGSAGDVVLGLSPTVGVEVGLGLSPLQHNAPPISQQEPAAPPPLPPPPPPAAAALTLSSGEAVVGVVGGSGSVGHMSSNHSSSEDCSSTALLLAPGSWVKVRHTNDSQTFVAQIKRRSVYGDKTTYRVHYRGYNRRHDNDISPEEIVEVLSLVASTQPPSHRGDDSSSHKEHHHHHTHSNTSGGQPPPHWSLMPDDVSTASENNDLIGQWTPTTFHPQPGSSSSPMTVHKRRVSEHSQSDSQSSPPKLMKNSFESSEEALCVKSNRVEHPVFLSMDHPMTAEEDLDDDDDDDDIDDDSDNDTDSANGKKQISLAGSGGAGNASSLCGGSATELGSNNTPPTVDRSDGNLPVVGSPEMPVIDDSRFHEDNNRQLFHHSGSADPAAGGSVAESGSVQGSDDDVDDDEDDEDDDDDDVAMSSNAPNTPSTLPMNDDEEERSYDVLSSSTLDSPMMSQFLDPDGLPMELCSLAHPLTSSPRRFRRTHSRSAHNSSFPDDESQFHDSLDDSGSQAPYLTGLNGVWQKAAQVKVPFEWPTERPYHFPYADFLPTNMPTLGVEERIKELERALQQVAEEWRNQKKLIRDIENNVEYKRMRKRLLNLSKSK